MREARPLYLCYVVDSLPSWNADQITDAFNQATEAVAFWCHQPIPVELYIFDLPVIGAVGIESKNFDDLYGYADGLNLAPGTILLLHDTRMAYGGFARQGHYVLAVYTSMLRKTIAHELGHYLGAADHDGGGDVMDRLGLGAVNWETEREILLAQGWKEP